MVGQRHECAHADAGTNDARNFFDLNDIYVNNEVGGKSRLPISSSAEAPQRGEPPAHPGGFPPFTASIEPDGNAIGQSVCCQNLVRHISIPCVVDASYRSAPSLDKDYFRSCRKMKEHLFFPAPVAAFSFRQMRPSQKMSPATRPAFLSKKGLI